MDNAFQSTHSLRSATLWYEVVCRSPWVSIHALLAECDDSGLSILDDCLSFNPRTPCGVRPVAPALEDLDMMFQSTHSLRSATENPIN